MRRVALLSLITASTGALAALPQGCILTDCGKACPSQLYKAATAFSDGNLSGTGVTCANNQPRAICCTVQATNVQWIPPAPTAGTPSFPVCQSGNPCGDRYLMQIDYVGDQPDKPCKQGGKYLCAGLPQSLPPVPAPEAKQTINSWQHRRCYTDDGNARTLDQTGTKDWSGMTAEKCVAEAQSKGYRYAGVEYYGECYYGNNIRSPGSQAGDGCNTPCAGDSLELCGGGNRLNLYENTAWRPPATMVPSVGTFKLKGCQTDSVNARALENVSQDWNGMTVENCVQIAAGYRYAGVEYYGECHYGNTLASSSTSANNADCNTPCAGNSGEFCGGDSRMALYENSAWTPPPTASMVPAVGSFKLKGCYTDNQNSRTVSTGDGGGSSTDWSGMTVEKCVGLAGNHRYAAVEYYGECYWGDVLGSSASKAADGDCSTACSGNNKQFCGGGNRVTLYENANWSPPPPPITRNDITSSIQSCVDCLQQVTNDAQAWYNTLHGKNRKRGPDPDIELENLIGHSTSCQTRHSNTNDLINRAMRQPPPASGALVVYQNEAQQFQQQNTRYVAAYGGAASWSATSVATSELAVSEGAVLLGIATVLVGIIVVNAGSGNPPPVTIPWSVLPPTQDPTNPPPTQQPTNPATNPPTTTTSTSSTTSFGCLGYTPYPDVPDEDDGWFDDGSDDMGSMRRRGFFGRFRRAALADDVDNWGPVMTPPPELKPRDVHGVLVKRAARSVTAFNGCTVSNVAALNNGKVKYPGYPNPVAVRGMEAASTTLKPAQVLMSASVRRWWYPSRATVQVNPTVCDYRYALTSVSAASLKPNPTVIKDANDNVDHVWDSSILTNFLNSRIGTAGAALNCGQANNLLFRTTDGTLGLFRMQSLYNKLPTNMDSTMGQQMEFAGLYDRINARKAAIFNNRELGNGWARQQTLQAKISYLEDMSLAWAFLNEPLISEYWVKTNTRMVNEFINLDNNIRAAKAADPTLDIGEPDWASSFRAYINNIVNTTPGAVSAVMAGYAAEVDAAITALPADDPQKGPLRGWLNSYRAHRATENWGFNFALNMPES